MTDHLKPALQYIVNTGSQPLPIEYFDDDNEPVGPMLRADLLREGLITEINGAVMLTKKAEELLT